jgi:TetR/AcrR family transcriptional repressor of nem operon
MVEIPTGWFKGQEGPSMTSKRDEILDKALDLVRTQGYHRMSLDAILNASSAGKGQFYYYFRSKEDFGYALLERAWSAYAESLTSSLGAHHLRSDDPLEAVFGVLDSMVESNRAQPSRGGCLFGTLAQELAAQHEGFRQRLASVFRRQIAIFADPFAQARDRGLLPADVDPSSLARFLVCVIEGGLILMKTENDITPLQESVLRFKEYVHLLSAGIVAHQTK